jgi:hypothetical protein
MKLYTVYCIFNFKKKRFPIKANNAIQAKLFAMKFLKIQFHQIIKAEKNA